MKRLFMAILLVGAVALVTEHDEPAPAPGVEQRDPNVGPVGSVG